MRVCAHLENDRPFIWGVAPPFAPRAPNELTFWFDRPARVRVELGSGILVTVVDRDKRLLTDGSPESGLAVLGGRGATVALAQIPLFEKIAFGRELALIMGAATEVARLGHGGALLLIPKGDDFSAFSGSLLPGQVVSEETRLFLNRQNSSAVVASAASFITGSEILGHQSAKQAAQDREEAINHGRKLHDCVKVIAGLTRIDGATVLDTDLILRSFGTQIITTRNTRTVSARTVFAPAPVEVPWSVLGGTRHRSAASFVATHPGTAALVVSQDGGMSALGWADDVGVVWLRQLEYLLFPI